MSPRAKSSSSARARGRSASRARKSQRPKSAALDTLLPALSEAYGPPGRETGIRSAVRRALRGSGEVREDALGNVHLSAGGKGKRVLLTAHMDAPGVIVTRVDSSGLARLSILGTLSAADLIGAVVALNGSSHGVVGWDRPKDAKDSREIEPDSLYLETGAGREASKRIEVGEVGALHDRAERLGNLWCGANLDNRAGCAAVLAALQAARGIRNNLHVVFSAQSDLGARGAATSTYGIDPDVAVVVDVAFVGESKGSGDITLGKGPCLGLKEEGYLPHPLALDFVKRAAKAARIQPQWLIRESGGSDARTVRAARAGVPTALVAIPARKTGGPRVLIHGGDLEQTVRLIRQIVTTPYTGEKGSR